MKKNILRKHNLPYTQNRNLGTLEKSCNLDAKTTKNSSRQILKGQAMFLSKNWKFSRFPSFRFCPTPEIKNLEISESLLLLQILTVVII